MSVRLFLVPVNVRLRQALVSASIVLVVLLLVGATYQGVATALERRRYPHPGQLHDVGGHQLHIFCTGEAAARPAAPTVVLEAPEGGMSASWGWVQPAVAEWARVCSYDRAGLGWSEAGDKPYDPGRVPEELHALLAAAKEPGPYVLAGHSLGAAFARSFAGRYPGEVLGLLLVDMPEAAARSDVHFFKLSPWLARTGLLRTTGTLSHKARGLPAREAGALTSFLNRPDHLTRTSREIARWDDAIRVAGTGDDTGVRRIELGADGLSDPQAARRVAASIRELATTARPVR
jgi:pimeloyl-ACP methyl ester carboxylesterase